jgi:hypothetical protein
MIGESRQRGDGPGLEGTGWQTVLAAYVLVSQVGLLIIVGWLLVTKVG